MHLLATTATSLDEIVEPVDLGQMPGDLVVASFAESDLAALAAAWAAERDSLPSLRLTPLRELRHPLSVDLWIDKVASHAKVIVLRLLGGLDWWRYGVEQLAAMARTRGIALALLPGEDRDDPRLAEASTLPATELATLLAYFREGGEANLRALLRRLAVHAGGALDAPAPQPLPRLAAYWRGVGAISVGKLVKTLSAFEARPSPVTSPRLRGEVDFERSEKSGEGDSPSARTCGEAPSPGSLRDPTSPRKRGEVERQGSAPNLRPVVAIIFYRAALLAADTAPIDALCEALAACGLAPAPLVVTSLKDKDAAAFVRAAIAQLTPALVITTTAFAAGELFADIDVPVLQAVIATTKRAAWEASARGLGAADLAMHVVLPELDGRVLAGAIAFKHPREANETLAFTALANSPEPNRIEFVADRAAALARLQAMRCGGRRIAVLMPDYPGAPGRSGFAVGLDVPGSVVALLADLAGAGYTVADAPTTSRALLDLLTAGAPDAALTLADYARLVASLPADARGAIAARWGDPASDPDLHDGVFHFRARAFGNVLVALPPDRGRAGERRADYHDATLPPRHALVAFMVWLRHVACVDALVHMGAHGTLEWLPGKAVALTASCFPELLVGPLPVIYPFIVSNPGEAAQAKRRIGALTIGHLPPPLAHAGLSGETRELERLVDEYAQADGLDRKRREKLARLIVETAQGSTLARAAGLAGDTGADEALRRIDAWLCDLKDLAIKDGLHVYARPSKQTDSPDPAWESSAAAERDALLAALDGRRIAPGPAGAPARGRRDVLPTGRNLFTADPRTLPSPTAFDFGRLAAEEVLRNHLQTHGDMPRALVLDLWGSATLRTGGEEIAQALWLMGCRPVWDPATARVTGVEVLPLASLGRARVDVTLRISGLFRDLFPAQIALFDAAVRAVATREESDVENPLAASRRAGEPSPARIFGNAPGSYGAGVEDLIAHGADRSDIGAAYLATASHSYGGAEGGATAQPGAFAQRIAGADLLLHVGDDPGRDLLDGAEDAAFVGGFAAAAASLGRAADLIMLDATDPQRPRARPLGAALARLVRGRVSERFVAGQMRHGPRGAAEFAQTVDQLFAFAHTTGAVDGALFDLLYDAYLADAEVREFLLRENTTAARAIAERLAEARRRGLWHPRRNDIDTLLLLETAP
jgi:cobaltochelatase CobN